MIHRHLARAWRGTAEFRGWQKIHESWKGRFVRRKRVRDEAGRKGETRKKKGGVV